MPRRLLALAVVLAALASGRVAAEDELDPARGIAWPAWATPHRTAFVAFAKGDARPLEAVVAAVGDPGLLALLFVTLREGVPEAPIAARLTEAARRVAQVGDRRAHEPWLAPLVEGWIAWDAATSAAHARSLALYTKVLDAGTREKWAQAVEAAAALDADLASADLWTVDAHRIAGYALLRLHKSAEAEQRLLRVIARAEALRLTSLAARAWTDLADERSTASDRVGELAAYGRAYALYDALGDRVRRANVRRGRGLALQRAGRLREALVETEAAVAEAEEAQAARETATARRDLGELYAVLGRYADARAAAERARAAFAALGLKAEAASALGTLGRVVARQGRFAEALELYEQALGEVSGDAAREAAIRSRIASVRLQMGDAAGALEQAGKARAVAEASGDTYAAAQRRALEGTALRVLGRSEEALAAHREALATVRGFKRVSEEAGLLADVAEDLRMLGRYPESRAAFEEALAAQAKSVDRPSGARTRDHMGRLLYAMGELEQALTLHREAAATLLESGCRDLAARALREAARDLLALRRPAEALQELRRALDLDRGALEGVGDGEAPGLLGARDMTVDLGLACVKDLGESGALPPEKAAREALWLIEDGRARLLSAGLDRQREILAATVPAALLEEEALVRARLDAARRDASAGRAGVDAAYAAYDEVVRKVVRSSRRAALASPPAPDPDRIVAALGSHDALLLLQVVGSDVCAVIVTPSGAVLRWLEGAQEILGAAATWFDLAGTPDGPEAALAAKLYDLLLRPLEPDLGTATRWLVAGGGLLSLLPLGALVRKGGAKAERLVERVEVASVPSGTVLALLREDAAEKPRGRGLVALGDPAGMEAAGLAPLAASAGEVRAIAALHPEGARTVLLGADATPERLRAALAGAGGRLAAVHLACHGTIDLERPRLTALRLAEGRTVGIDALMTWRLAADVFVLAACETARGRVVVGEGVLGFPRALFLAGVPRVVVTPWRVSDETAGPVLLRFHTLVAKDGLAPSAALRQAQLERLRAGGPLAHPYHWAGFMLWGLPD